MGWKWEYKSNLWSDCVGKGHSPVIVAISGSSLNAYCCECKKVWRVVTVSKLSSVTEDDLLKMEDCVWKGKVLELMSRR